jgi:cell surface protein SprA
MTLLSRRFHAFRDLQHWTIVRVRSIRHCLTMAFLLCLCALSPALLEAVPLPAFTADLAFGTFHSFEMLEMPTFSSLAFLCNRSLGNSILLDSLPSERSTSASLMLNSTTTTINAANIPLLSEPVINVNALADSLGLGLRRGVGGGGRGGLRSGSLRGIDGMPYGSIPYTPQSAYEYRSLYDTLNRTPRVNVRERIFGTDIGEGQTYSLDDYVRLRRDYLRERISDSTLHAYDFRRPFKLELSSILGGGSSFNIPFPIPALTTIFGKPELRLNVNLEVNVRLGGQWNTSNLGVNSVFGQTQFGPIFSQNFQANVDAGIGDKFKINLDAASLRQFEFDNLIRFAYDGDADEIFRKIEVGNVSLNSPSTFISGSQALFGARLDLQFGPVFVKALLSQKRGQRKTASVKGGSVKQAINLRAYDYATNHFFVDIRHKRFVWPAYARTAPNLDPSQNVGQFLVKELEVWESTTDLREVNAANAVVVDSIVSAGFGPTARYQPQQYANVQASVGSVEKGRFKILPKDRFEADFNLGTLTIFNLRADRTYAVAYRLEGNGQGEDDDPVYGTLTRGTPIDTTALLKLQLVFRPQMQPGFKQIWARQMQNIYFIGASGVSPSASDTKINFIYYNQRNDSTDILEGAPSPGKVATVLGVDRVNNATGEAKPDGMFDMHLPYVFNAARGEIIFPSLEPFRSGIREYFAAASRQADAEKYVFDAVYDTTREAARMNAARDRFVITGEVSGRAGSRITLPNAFNLAPGSVVVKLDGTPLTEYQDYRVEYYTGQVEILAPRALLPNANVEVEYEQADAFNLAIKSMAGIRIDLDTKPLLRSRDVKADIGATIMLYDQNNQNARLRLGEEPIRNTMVGIDGQITYNADWLTKALDLLPFFDTKAASSLSLRGEIAWMLPTPNSRRSTIQSDNGLPSVFVDDFEASQRVYSLGMQPTQWRYASAPVSSQTEQAEDLQNFRARTVWFSFDDPREPTKNVYPNRSIQTGLQGNQNIRPFEIDFNPDVRGIYNTNPNFLDAITYAANRTTLNFAQDSTARRLFSQQPENRSRTWGGIMRALSAFNTNFDNDNIEYLEVIMRVESETETDRAQMFVDVGQISEDVLPNGQLDTEDGILPGKETPNGIIAAGEEGEDVGLDGLNNAQEKAADTTGLNIPPIIQRVYGGRPLPRYAAPMRNEEDPARDNFAFPFERFNDIASKNLQRDSDYVRFNGIEANGNAESTKFPDTEVLNPNNGQTVMLGNDFFRYPIDISNLDPNTNPQIVNRTGTGWVTFRIPLRRNPLRIGNPLFTNLQYVRVWWKGGRVKARIADWRFVGSQWIRQIPLNSASLLGSGVVPVGTSASTVVDDPTLTTGFISVEDNSGPPDYYTVPPGVERATQINTLDPNQVAFQNEQSLNLRFTNLPVGEERQVARFFRPFDIFFYKQLKFFFHGESTLGTPESREKAAIAFIRFGVDTANYYEYSIPLRSGWMDLGINLTDITNLKQRPDYDSLFRRNGFYTARVEGNALAEVKIKGYPTLTRIQYVAFGLQNPATNGLGGITTNMWVNEMRLVEPDSKSDWAAVVNATAKLADLGSITASYNVQNPYFHRLEERFGNRNQRQAFTVSMQFALERFLPEAWSGSAIPFTYTHTESFDSPNYKPQNDINIRQFAENEAQTISDAGARSSFINDRLRASQTLVVEDQWAIVGARLNVPVNSFVFRDFFNRLSFNYAYAQRFERSPVVSEKFDWRWRFQTAYTHSFAQIPITPFGWAGTTMNADGSQSGDSIPVLKYLKDWRLFLMPNTFRADFDLTRNRTTEESRFGITQSIDIQTGDIRYDTLRIPVVRAFDVSRSMQFTWKVEENGFLNPMHEYAVQTVGTLSPLETNITQDTILNGAQVLGKIFGRSDGTSGFGVNLGVDRQHSQSVTWNFRPRLPDFMGGSRFAVLSGNFLTRYSWERLLRGDNDNDLNKGVTYQNTINGGLTFRFRELLKVLIPVSSFITPAAGGMLTQQLQDVNAPNAGMNPDGTGIVPTQPGVSIGESILRGLRTVLDFEQFSVNFNQQNSAANPGVFGGTGFGNAWLVGNNLESGPSWAYQMGLVREPHNTFSFDPRTFTFSEIRGPRPLNAFMQDRYSQATTLDFRTQRELWQGAQLEINSNGKFEYLRTQTVVSDSGTGRPPSETNVKVINSTLYSTIAFGTPKDVDSRYQQKKAAAFDGKALKNTVRERIERELTNEAFREGITGIAIPLNWAFRWNGLEQFAPLKGILRSGSLEHKYVGSFRSTESITDAGKVVEQQSSNMSFEPLVGITAQFDDKFVEGIMSGSARYGTKTSHGMTSSAPTTISTEVSNDLSVQISYTRRGFELPKIGGLDLLKLIGIDIKFTNDMEFAMQGTYRRTLRSVIDLAPSANISNAADALTNGRRVDGTTNILFEPSVRYTVSKQVTARLFFRYEAQLTEGAAAPGTSTTQFGLDLRLTLSGGRNF